MNFEHDYVVPSDVSFQDKVLCMRCGNVILESRYEMQRMFNSKDEIAVYAPHRLGSYRQVAVDVQDGEHHHLMHIMVCEGCMTFELTTEIGERIIKQIERAAIIQMKWCGMPEEAQRAMSEKYSQMKIVRRLQGEELSRLYKNREAPYASNI